MKLTRKEYTDPAEKKKDFWLGFWLWWGLNILLWVITTAASVGIYSIPSNNDTTLTSLQSIASIVLGVLPLLVNLGLLIYFALTRGQIALGMLVAFGVALALVVLLGIIFTVACFILLGSYNNP
jgi:cytosine/uracil/thiamine/allantoin permease